MTAAHQGGVGVRTRLLFIVAHVSRICKGSHAARDSPGSEDWPDEALQKRIRGIVVGDFIRGVVARTVAQQLGPAVEQHTSLFQFALSTSGCECVAHIAQVMTDLDPTTTLLSVDGIGAFDLVSREAVVAGACGGGWGRRCPPFRATIPRFTVNVLGDR